MEGEQGPRATVVGPLDLERLLVARVCVELGQWRAQLPRQVLEEEARVSG